MKPRWTIGFAAALGASLCGASHASAQAIAEAPAVFRGTASCPSRYPGSFLDIGTAACWSCPSTHPHRTIFPVGGGAACERRAREVFRKAVGPERPTGLIGTDCKKGWFLDIGRGRCYSCEGYRRTAYAIEHARACARLIPAGRTEASRRGTAACPAGSFRHGLTDRCYACPKGYGRNLVIADDLTKVNACTRLSFTQQDETRAKFAQNKDDRPQSRANLGRSVRNAATAAKNVDFDQMRRDLMKSTLEDELERDSGFETVSWLLSAGGAVGVGFTHGEGFVITKVDGVYSCRKAWANAFSAGAAARGALADDIGLSKGGIAAGRSESNGWQIGASFPPVNGAFSLHWDATTGEMSMGGSTGWGAAIGISLSEYVHTWSEVGKVVDCEKMTWGSGWKDL